MAARGAAALRPTVVSFDCAQTLVRADWRPAEIAVDSAARAGLAFDRQVAAEVYDRKLRSRWPDFMRLNLSRDEAVLDRFWRELTAEWLQESGMPTESVEDVVLHANEILFGEGSLVFQLYDDTLPCLERLRAAGYRMAVVSNWDNSLHRTLRVHGLTPYFELVVASLEEGVEKPDPRIFQIALERLGVQASEVLHVGDNAVDDWQGARDAGLRALLVDRGAESQNDVRVTSLIQLAEVLGA
jgi:putative hydrolase of the HAD superfamily